MNRTQPTTARSAVGAAWSSVLGIVGRMGRRSAGDGVPAPI